MKMNNHEKLGLLLVVVGFLGIALLIAYWLEGPKV